jgi:hypothetical protein
MTGIQHAMSAAAYALFALDQQLDLPEIAQGVRAGSFPAAATHTPEWFSAAADGADLLEMAPELQVLPADLAAAEEVDLTGIDLIHVYAPEMHLPVEEHPEPVAPAPGTPPPPRTSTQLGLLKELDNLDD